MFTGCLLKDSPWQADLGWGLICGVGEGLLLIVIYTVVVFLALAFVGYLNGN